MTTPARAVTGRCASAAVSAICPKRKPPCPSPSTASPNLENQPVIPEAGEYELLASGARSLGVALSPAAGAALLRLVDELEAGNAQFNLTAIRDRLGMLRK